MYTTAAIYLTYDRAYQDNSTLSTVEHACQIKDISPIQVEVRRITIFNQNYTHEIVLQNGCATRPPLNSAQDGATVTVTESFRACALSAPHVHPTVVRCDVGIQHPKNVRGKSRANLPTDRQSEHPNDIGSLHPRVVRCDVSMQHPKNVRGKSRANLPTGRKSGSS